MSLLLIAAPASAQTVVDLVWTSTTGSGTPGSSTIEAVNGDVLTADLRITPDPFYGMSAYFVSVEFDQVLDDELDLNAVNGATTIPGFIPFVTSPQSTSESTGSLPGTAYTFNAYCSFPPCGVFSATWTIGTLTFQVKNVSADGDDVSTGLFGVGVDEIYDYTQSILIGAFAVYLGAAVDGQGGPQVDLVWTSSSGSGIPGSDDIAARDGDLLEAELRLTPGANGISGYSLSVEFDQALDDELDLVQAVPIANPEWPNAIGGNPDSTSESSGSAAGSVLSFAAECTTGPPCGPNSGSYPVGKLTFRAKNTASDVDDVFSGLFGIGDDLTASDRTTSLAGAATFNNAKVDALPPASPAPFLATRHVIASGTSAGSMIPTDLDGDGDLDVLAAFFYTQRIDWYENTDGAGTFALGETLLSSANGARQAMPGDFDGDGDLDVVAVVQYDDTVGWFENRLNEIANDFGPEQSIAQSPAVDDTNAVDAADLDGDGDVDVVAIQLANDRIVWHENLNGLGSFSTQNLIGATGDTQPTSVDLGDVDRDGDLDVLATLMYDNEVIWYQNRLNEISNDFGPRQLISDAVALPTRVVAADVDGDGDLDATSASQSDGKVAWYENTDGLGSFGPQQVISIEAGVLKLAAGDVDGDGDVDIVSIPRGEDQVTWYENTAGDGSSWSEHTIFDGVDDPQWVEVGDMDGDGDLDVLALSHSDSTVAWHENLSIHRSAPFAPGLEIATADDSSALAGADIDRDGDMDLVSSSDPDNDVVWLRNDGSSWASVIVDANFSGGADEVGAADMDRDGEIEVVAISTSTDTIAYYQKLNASGTSWSRQTISHPSGVPVHLDLGDIDRDSNLDIVVGYGGSLRWYEYASWNERTIAFGSSNSGPAAVADMDRDGHLDVVWCRDNPFEIYWYENDHTPLNGGWLSRLVASPGARPGAIDVADIDGDGDPDVAVVTTTGDDELNWYENVNGDAMTWSEHFVGSQVLNASDVQAVDVDRDGDLDLVSTSAADDTLEWFENLSGDGLSWAGTELDTNVDQAAGLFAGDLDRDGDPDVVALSENGGALTLYENQGGQFSLPTVATAAAGIAQGQLDDLLRFDVVHEGTSGEDDIELARLELRFDDESGATPLTDSQLNALVAEIRLYLDDGDTQFEPGADDILVQTAAGPFGAGGTGLVSILLDNGAAELQVAQGTPRSYFVAVELQAAAGSAPVTRFQALHITEASSRAEHSGYDSPLDMADQANQSSGVTEALDPLGDADSDGLSNADELIYGTDPHDPDSDDDGLNDGTEVALGLDPTNSDSDADGVCDGGVVVAGCTVVGPDNCPLVGSSPDQTNSDSLPAGDLCQCGDVDDNGVVDSIDQQLVAENLVGHALGGPTFVPKRCNVIGDSDGGATDCDVRDLYVLERLVGGDPSLLQNVCNAYLGL